MEIKNRKCPYCDEEIRAEAKKCRYCGEWLTPNELSSSAQTPKVSHKFVNIAMIKDILIFTGIMSPVMLVNLAKDTYDISELTISRSGEAFGIFFAIAVIGLIFGYVFWLLINTMFKLLNLKFDFFASPRKMIFITAFLFSVLCLIGAVAK